MKGRILAVTRRDRHRSRGPRPALGAIHAGRRRRTPRATRRTTPSSPTSTATGARTSRPATATRGPSRSSCARPRGGFAEEAGSPFRPGATSNGAVGDFNGDGRPDSRSPASSATASCGRCCATRQAGSPAKRTAARRCRPSAVGAGDFNRDGRLDIAVATTAAQRRDPAAQRRPTTGSRRRRNALYTVGTQPAPDRVADFDGDLGLDLAVTNDRSNSVVRSYSTAAAAIFSPEAGRSRSARRRTGSPPATSTATDAPISRSRNTG